MRLFEICLSDGYSICIKGTEVPTTQTAGLFLGEDELHGATVTDVLEIDEEYARDSFDFSRFDSWPVYTKDRTFERLWREFTDVPMDPETETICEEFRGFPEGTDRETIWHWFDENHSKGVYYLLYEFN